jgi:uncharacterized membrane protein YdfJ with MMPL/SSD domain
MRPVLASTFAVATTLTLVGALAAPAFAHDDSRDGGHQGRSDDHAVSQSAAGSSSPSESSDDAMDDANDAMDDANDAMDDANDAMDDANDAMDDANDGMEFRLMGSVPTDPTIATVAPGGKPWVIKEGEAELENGVLTVKIVGLVIPPLPGTNPIPKVAASVVCGNVVVDTTATVDFSATGNAWISEAVTVPSPCDVPRILVNPNGNAKAYIAFS